MQNLNIQINMKHFDKKLCVLLFFFFIQQFALAGNDWTVYPSYKDITEIEPTGKDVFVLASKSIYSYNPSDGQIIVYNKINGLSDTEIEHITWSKNTKRLIIAYKNSNIDLLSLNGDVVNIPGLFQKQMTLSKDINNIYIYNEFAYLSTKFGIVKLDVKNEIITDSYQLGFSVEYCYIKDNKLYAVSKEQGMYECSFNKNLLDKNNWNRIGDYTPQNVNRKNVYDSTNNYWWATTEDGKLTYYKLDANNERVYMTEGIEVNGPASNNFYRIYINNNKLYGLSGIWNQEIDGGRRGEVHVLEGDKWSEFERPTDPEADKIFKDPLCMDFDPKDGDHVMIGTKNGLYEYRNKKFVNLYNHSNSELRSRFNTLAYTLITSVKYDNNGTLWALNSYVPDCITNYSESENKWTSFKNHNEFAEENSFDLERLFISPTNGKMWFVNNYYKLTFVYSYDYINDKLEKYGPSLINQDNKDLNANYVYTTKEDKYGNVWIGTSGGPIYLSASDIRNGKKTFIQHKVPRNDGTNFADYLLSNIDIRAIAIDGGNRKWFGTGSNGVFLISDDNNTQIAHFTTNNSPLLSNIIQDIAIDGQTGRVYFATDKGLCSYQSDATEPNIDMNKDDVYAYPNPVTPDYTGEITIVGLSFNADVKIVTVNGTLVNQGKSTGGTYKWDGNDLNGRRVASGIYMVEVATAEGEKGTVCKIAIVN